MTPPPGASAASVRTPSAGRAPSPAALSGAPAVPRPAVPRLPRRVSGPAVPGVGGRRRSRRDALPASELGIAERLRSVLDAPVLDRLTRGRAWIALIAAGLIGIVFMQVSLLRLNTGIGRSIQKAQALERQNAQLRDTVAQLASGDRIQTAAQRRGMVMPAADAFHYLDAGRRGDLRRLLRIIEPPVSPVPETVAGQVPGAGSSTPAVTEPQTTAQPPAATTPAPDTPATDTASPDPASGTPAPADPVTSTAPGTPSAAPAAPDDPVATAPPPGTTTPGQ